MGTSFGLVIDKPVLELLNINQDTPLKVTTDGSNLIISPIHDEAIEHAFQDSLNRITKRRKKVFEKLAK